MNLGIIKLFVLTIAFLGSGLLFSQTSVAKIFITDSNIVSIKEIVNENELIEYVYVFNEGIPDANYELYSKDRQTLLITGEIFKGKKNGVWNFYYEFGTIKCSIDYKDGMKNGKEIRYDKEGRIYDEIPYKKDLVDGARVQYYSNGSIKTIINYSNDIFIGKAENFDKD